MKITLYIFPGNFQSDFRAARKQIIFRQPDEFIPPPPAYVQFLVTSPPHSRGEAAAPTIKTVIFEERNLPSYSIYVTTPSCSWGCAFRCNSSKKPSVGKGGIQLPLDNS